MNILEEEHRIMRIMAEKHGEKYFSKLGGFLFAGMDIRTAIWECWNQLECGGKNG